MIMNGIAEIHRSSYGTTELPTVYDEDGIAYKDGLHLHYKKSDVFQREIIETGTLKVKDLSKTIKGFSMENAYQSKPVKPDKAVIRVVDIS